MLRQGRGRSPGQPDLPVPSDRDRSRRFYRDLLGLAIYRVFGPQDDPGMSSLNCAERCVPGRVPPGDRWLRGH